MTCPLCQSGSAQETILLAGRATSRCSLCSLVFVHSDEHLELSAELKRYQTHQNNREDPRYVEFLSRLIDPLIERVNGQSQFLDFGSGPTPVLAELLRERNYDIAVYDPFFAPDRSVLSNSYDAIACCETVEHFRDPLTEWTVMTKCLRPGGWLGVMTLMYDEETDLNNWWYAQDPTHICFYSEETMKWIADKYRLSLVTIGNRIALFQKKRDSD